MESRADRKREEGRSNVSTQALPETTQPIRTERYLQGNRYVIRFELPGLNPATGLDVSIEAQVLTVHAERVQHGTCHSEFGYGQFCSHVTLPAASDDDDIAASYEKGILEVSVGMSHQPSVRSVKVTVPPATR
jgi:HSP20 family protein